MKDEPTKRGGRTPKHPDDLRVHITIRLPGRQMDWVRAQPGTITDVVAQAVEEKMEREAEAGGR